MRRLLTCLSLALLTACSHGDGTAPAAEQASAQTPAAPEAPPPADPFEAWLNAPVAAANGFVAPVGRGWRGCGDGCWETAAPREARVAASGRVLSADAGEIRVAHLWYEGHERREAISSWRGLRPAVQVGQLLKRGQPLGQGRRLEASITGAVPLAELIRTRDQLFVPQDEPTLALISHDAYQLRLYRAGQESGRYDVSFGQQTGAKERRGDNRTPKGMYFVVARSKGPFAGPVADYYGGHWIKLSYPSAWDAARGADQGLITADQQRAITRDWRARRLTLQGTALGGGLGLHGWAYEWPDDGPRHLSWGCVVLHLRDVAAIYAALPEGSMVVIF